MRPPFVLPFCLAALAVAAVSAGPAKASVITVYREVFPNDSVDPSVTQNQRVEMNVQGWFGRQHGVEPFTPPQNVAPLFPGLSGQITKPASGSPTVTTPVNSNPVGPTADTGSLFWSPGNRNGIYLYTNEFPGLNSADIRTVTFESNNNPIANPTAAGRMRLAFLLNGTDWYISDQGVSQTQAGWQLQTFDLATLTFGLFNDHNMGESLTSLPRNNDASTGLSLPAGTVTAFGIYVATNNQVSMQPNPTIFIDNYAIQAEVAIPEPGTLALFAAAGVGLVGAARRRARRA